MEEQEGKKQEDSGRYFLFFYWNPKDKRMFVPKRWGYGWTVNFANPFSIAAFVALIVLTALLPRIL